MFENLTLVVIIANEVSIILLQHETFFCDISLILKIIDIILACFSFGMLKIIIIKHQWYKIMIIASILRVAIQFVILYFFRDQILSVFLNLSLILSLYQEELDNQIKIQRITYLFLIGIIFMQIDFHDNLITVGLAFTCLSILFQFKPTKNTNTSLHIDSDKKGTKDFEVHISALPYKEQDQYKSYDINGSNGQSPVYGGISPLKELSRSMDSQLLDEYAWIKGQQFIVFDEQENIIVQTFNIAEFSRQSFSQNYSMDFDSVAAILQLGVIQGNRDFQDLMASSGSINQSKFTLKDLINKIIGDYELYKNNMFIINKVDAQWMQDWIVKLFLVSRFRRIFVFVQIDIKEIVYQPSYQAFTQFSSYITPSLNSIMTISVLSQSDNLINEYILEKYFYPIRVASIIIYLHLANMRDFNLHYQKKLLLRINSIDINAICEEVMFMLTDAAKAKGIDFKMETDVTEPIESDQERLKQLLLPLLKYFIKVSRDETILLQWKAVPQTKNYQVSLYTPTTVEEKELRLIRLNLKKSTLQFSEFSVCHLLCQYLSGTIKSGLSIQQIEPNGTIFTFLIQSFNVNNEEMKAIRLINGTHYQETSLSQLLAMQDNTSKQNEQTFTLFREGTNKISMDHSLHFSQSRISKQFSQKYSEYQSNYLSQISKIKADSVNFPGSRQIKDSHSFEQISMQNFGIEEDTRNQRQNYQTTPSQTKYQLPHFPEVPVGNSIGNSVQNSGNGSAQHDKNSFTGQGENREREQTFLSQPPSAELLKHQPNSYLDFGTDTITPIQIPLSGPLKMQSDIIKFSTTGKCCSRVLIADCEFQNIQILELILAKFRIISTRAFSTEEVIKLVETKKKCKCGNKGFVLYFINVDLPKKGGLWLSRQIKEKMTQKGYIIGTTGLVEYYSKIEYYRNGIDQYISLPFDLAEVSKILQISQRS